jgi:hypothetical protein
MTTTARGSAVARAIGNRPLLTIAKGVRYACEIRFDCRESRLFRGPARRIEKTGKTVAFSPLEVLAHTRWHDVVGGRLLGRRDEHPGNRL